MYKIMIIDDDATSLAITQALLEDEYDVVMMSSGLQALEYLKGSSEIDLILLDMMMPGTDGMTVLHALKSDSHTKNIPVILLTSLDGMNLKADVLLAGASDFLTKPVHQQLMKIKISHHIQFARYRLENQILKQRVKLILKILEDVEV